MKLEVFMYHQVLQMQESKSRSLTHDILIVSLIDKHNPTHGSSNGR